MPLIIAYNTDQTRLAYYLITCIKSNKSGFNRYVVEERKRRKEKKIRQVFPHFSFHGLTTFYWMHITRRHEAL